jgi:alanine-alpha-ketoisovalerate/valine-pyruvate aminotransferase
MERLKVHAVQVKIKKILTVAFLWLKLEDYPKELWQLLREKRKQGVVEVVNL